MKVDDVSEDKADFPVHFAGCVTMGWSRGRKRTVPNLQAASSNFSPFDLPACLSTSSAHLWRWQSDMHCRDLAGARDVSLKHVPPLEHREDGPRPAVFDQVLETSQTSRESQARPWARERRQKKKGGNLIDHMREVSARSEQSGAYCVFAAAALIRCVPASDICISHLASRMFRVDITRGRLRRGKNPRWSRHNRWMRMAVDY